MINRQKYGITAIDRYISLPSPNLLRLSASRRLHHSNLDFSPRFVGTVGMMRAFRLPGIYRQNILLQLLSLEGVTRPIICCFPAFFSSGPAKRLCCGLNDDSPEYLSAPSWHVFSNAAFEGLFRASWSSGTRHAAELHRASLGAILGPHYSKPPQTNVSCRGRYKFGM